MPDGQGFKMGDAYVDVHIDGDKAATEAVGDLKRRKMDFTKWADDAGEEAGDKLGEKIGDGAVKGTKKKVDKEGGPLGKWIAISIFGGLPAAAEVAGAAAGLALAGVGVAVVGLGALAVSQNRAVQQSTADLWATVKDGTVNAAAPLAGSFVDATRKINTELKSMDGGFQRMFRGAEPAIGAVADGLLGLVRESLPGINAGLEKSGPALAGFSSLLTSTGTGIGLFFKNTAGAAESSGVMLASFGRIIRDLLGFAGSFFAQLSNVGAPAGIRFEQVLNQLENTILKLGQGAFPVMFTAASEMLNVFSGLLSVFGQFAPVLGPLSGSLLSLVAVSKVLNLLSFGKLGGEFGKLKQSIGDADGARGKFSAGFHALGSGFGLAGIAAIGVTAVLGMLGKQQEEAAKKTQQHEDRVGALAAALRQSKGAIDENVRSTAAAQLADMKLMNMKQSVLEMSRDLGLNLGQVTDAYLGQAGAQYAVNSQLDAMISSSRSWNDVSKNGTEEEKKRLGWATLLKQAFGDTNGELHQAIIKNQDLAGATATTNTQLDNMTGAQKRGKVATAGLKSAFDDLTAPMSDVATRGKAIADVFDRLTGRQPDIEGTTRAWHEFIDNLKGTDWDSAAAGGKKWADALIDADGKINTTSKDGRTLFDIVAKGRLDFDNTAAAMTAAGIPADQMGVKLQSMRDEFIKTMHQMGFTKTEAENLANAYGLVPSTVTTLASSGGTVPATAAEVMILGGRLRGLPLHTPVTVDALTAPARQQLIDLGITVHDLPDGRVEVSADTNTAADSLAAFVREWERRKITMKAVVVVPPLAQQAKNMNSVQYAGGTDFHPGGIAMVGEKGPEIVSLPRGSKVYTADETKQMITGVGGSPHTPNTTTASSIVNNWYVTAPPNTDLNAFAEMLSRRFELRMRLGMGG